MEIVITSNYDVMKIIYIAYTCIGLYRKSKCYYNVAKYDIKLKYHQH